MNDNERNCHESGTAPCKTACPAHIAIQGYIKMAGEGRYLDALKLIKKDNPFPAVCGSVCNRRCEDACTRGSLDRAVSIDEIKKFIAERELNEKDRYIPMNSIKLRIRNISCVFVITPFSSLINQASPISAPQGH